MPTIVQFSLQVLILIVWCNVSSMLLLEPKISFESSSNFKAMEGVGFDMTCTINHSATNSFEIILPNGNRAENNSYITLGRPWKTNSIELKIVKADKFRDEGLYKCIINASRIVENKVEFISESFLNLSTPKPNIRVNKDIVDKLELVIDFAALPFPDFFYAVSISHFNENNLRPLDVKATQVSPNQLKFSRFNQLSPVDEQIVVVANNAGNTESIQFRVVVEGRPEIKVAVDDKSVAHIDHESFFNEITDASLFYPHKDDKPNQFYWKDFSNAAWIFQPCYNITTCTPLHELNKNSTIIGGILTSIQYFFADIISLPRIPGYYYVLAENDLDIGKFKIGFNLKGSVKVSILTTSLWNPFSRRYEVANGENVVMECETSFHYDIDWKLNNVSISNATKISNQIHESQHTKTQQIEIRNVIKADDGRYSCFDSGINNNTFSNRMQQLKVIKKVPPKIQSNFHDLPNHLMTRKVGDVVQLECNGKQTKSVSIRNLSWHKDGQLLTETNKSSLKLIPGLFKLSLKIEKLKSSDAGKYSCVAVNDFGRDEHFVEITFRDNKHFIIGGLVIVLISIIIIFAFYIRVHLAKKEILELKASGLANFEEGNLESFNKLLGLNEQADLLPYDPRYEFPLEKLTLQEQLGSGAFGVVYKAIAKGIKPMENETIVAVKTINKLAPNEMLKALVVELKIMVHMGQHLNIVNLLGAITKNIAKRDLKVISEYCCYGDLEGFLRKHRSFFKVVESANTSTSTASRSQLRYVNLQTNLIENPTTNGSVSIFNTDNLISWSFQVACGMDYLASKKILHGDLAARNVLLCADYIVKISDFGLAKSLYQNYVYQRKDDALLPYKWLALECLIDNTFSVCSDIWAYGVLVWEIFTLGQMPYPEIIGIESLLNKLQSGYRLPKPEFSSQAIYEIMLDCWKTDQKQRPSFTELEQRFGDMLQKTVKTNLIARNEPFMKANQESIKNGRIDLASLLNQESKDEPGSVTGTVQNPYETRNYLKPSVV